MHSIHMDGKLFCERLRHILYLLFFKGNSNDKRNIGDTQRKTRSLRSYSNGFRKCFQLNLMSLLTSFNGSGCFHILSAFRNDSCFFFIGVEWTREKKPKKNTWKRFCLVSVGFLFFYFNLEKHSRVAQFAINIHIMAGIDYRSSNFLGFNGHTHTLACVEWMNESLDSVNARYFYNLLMDIRAASSLWRRTI